MSNLIFVQETERVSTSGPEFDAAVPAAAGKVHRFQTTQEATEYLEANPGTLPSEEDLEHLVDEEFPAVVRKPTAKEVVDSVAQFDSNLHSNPQKLPFQIGQWVERLGDDQVWHLEPIRRIVVQYNVKEKKEEYYYKTEADVLVLADDVRCSEEGLKREFGLRPHLWLQWALFRMERQIRFQEMHEYDFLAIQYKTDAKLFWDQWLQHPRNADFLQLFRSKPQHVQDKLVHHMLSPFQHMDQVMFKWPLDDVEASTFHYNSFLGSGWVTSAIVLTIQLAVPFLILVYSARVSPRFPTFTMEPNSSTVDLELIFGTSWDDFCTNHTPLDQLIMQYIILVVYVIRVFPVVYNTFYQTVGDSPEVVSKLNSIRILSFAQGDDNVSMKCGYKLFTYMKSAYIALINLILLFVLFLTNSTIDIILNALALEFVSNFDLEVASKDWYDEGKRFFRAGVLEIMFLNYIALEDFDTVESFCHQYNVDMGTYSQSITGALNDADRAKVDALDPQFMDVKERMWRSMAYVAKKHRMRDAIWQYEEQCSTFGVIDGLLLTIAPRWVRGIFNRYEEYGAWSKWDVALFLPPVPLQQDIVSFVPNSEILNFHPDSMVHPMLRFARWLRSALLFGTVVANVDVVYRRKQYALVPIMFLDGVFEWFTFVFILFLFPAGLATYMFFVIECQPLLLDKSDNPVFSDAYAFGG